MGWVVKGGGGWWGVVGGSIVFKMGNRFWAPSAWLSPKNTGKTDVDQRSLRRRLNLARCETHPPSPPRPLTPFPLSSHVFEVLTSFVTLKGRISFQSKQKGKKHKHFPQKCHPTCACHVDLCRQARLVPAQEKKNISLVSNKLAVQSGQCVLF